MNRFNISGNGPDQRPETVKTITITPNYDALFERFKDDAMLHFAHLSRHDRKTFTRKEVYDFIASLRIALGALTKEEQIVTLREEFDHYADKMFTILTKEQEEEWES
jgi:hypothetical protein